MDFLGFFKGKNHFLEFKNTFKPLNPPQPHRIPDFGLGAARRSAARVRLGGHWLPHAIPRGVVRLGAVRAGVWPRLDWPSHSGSRRAGCGHAGVWSPVHHTGQ
jgi:hypothetical protein